MTDKIDCEVSKLLENIFLSYGCWLGMLALAFIIAVILLARDLEKVLLGIQTQLEEKKAVEEIIENYDVEAGFGTGPAMTSEYLGNKL